MAKDFAFNPPQTVIHHHPDYSEYRVTHNDRKDSSSYSYHDDKKDAEDTARSTHGKEVMIKHRSMRYSPDPD